MIAQDRQLAQAIQAGQRGPIQARLNQLASDNGIRRGVMTLEKAGRFETGRGEALAPARTRLLDAKGGTAGVLTLSAVGAEEYAQLTERVTGADVVVRSGEQPAGLDAPGRRRGAPARPGPGRDRRPRAARDRLRRPWLQRRACPGPPARRARERRPQRRLDRGHRDPAGGADRRVRVRAHGLALAAGPDRAPARRGAQARRRRLRRSRCRPRATTSSPRSAPSST